MREETANGFAIMPRCYGQTRSGIGGIATLNYYSIISSASTRGIITMGREKARESPERRCRRFERIARTDSRLQCSRKINKLSLGTTNEWLVARLIACKPHEYGLSARIYMGVACGPDLTFALCRYTQASLPIIIARDIVLIFSDTNLTSNIQGGLILSSKANDGF